MATPPRTFAPRPQSGSPAKPSRASKMASSKAGRQVSAAATLAATHTKRGLLAARFNIGEAIRTSSANYVFLLAISAALILFGLLMVFSASYVTSVRADGQFYSVLLRQLLSVAIAVPLAGWVSRFKVETFSRIALPALLATIGFQVLVFTGLGYDSGGNRNWLDLGFVTVQPSEFMKLSIAIWLGVRLPAAIAQYGPYNWRVLRPLVIPVIGMGLVVLGSDLGTAMILAFIILGALFFAGVSWRVILIPTVVGALGVLLLIITSPNRMNRILSSLGATCVDYTNACWQPLHGKWALAAGGIFGVGLGNSKAKWSWLPAADNDYIFAIIGEEGGLIGAATIIFLFVALAVIFLRIIRSSRDPIARITTGAIMIWLIGQAFINISVVLGLLPVLGVPLPLLSSGGTALIAGLLGIGVVASFAREGKPLKFLQRSRRK